MGDVDAGHRSGGDGDQRQPVAIESLETAGIDWGLLPARRGGRGAPYVSSWTDQFAVFADSQRRCSRRVRRVPGHRRQPTAGGRRPRRAPRQRGRRGSGWAEESAGRADVARRRSPSRTGIFVPGFWDVTAPLWDSFDLMVEEELTAQEALDESHPDAGQSRSSLGDLGSNPAGPAGECVRAAAGAPGRRTARACSSLRPGCLASSSC